MPEQYLTKERFERFEDKFDRFCEKLDEQRVENEKRFTRLEVFQKQSQSRTAWLAGILSSVIATVITSIIAWAKFGR